MSIVIAPISFSSPLLRVMDRFLANPEWNCGLVRLSDEQQIVVTENCADSLFFPGITSSQAVRIKRSDLWLPQDLAAFNLEWPQRLRANDPNSVYETSWRGKMPGSDQYRRFRTQYRLIDDGGVLYHACISMGWDEIPEPMSEIA